MKIVLRIIAGLFAAVVIAATALMLTFTEEKLDLPRVDVGTLPSASPPKEMSISALPTGAMESRAEFAFRGGKWNDIRQFSMTALLVRHPKGNLLIDTGFGRDVDKHVAMMPPLFRSFTKYSKGTPAAAQLAAGGVDAKTIAGVIITHAHWDHVSGLDGLPGVPVLVNAAEADFIRQKGRNTELINSFDGINYKPYEFDGGPYLGFPKSHDVYGDGSIVIVPSPGHTPGSVVAFVTLPSGRRYALLGDLVWQSEAVDIPAQRPWLVRRMLGENDAEVRDNIGRIVSIAGKFPEIKLLPAHDERSFRMLPVFPDKLQ